MEKENYRKSGSTNPDQPEANWPDRFEGISLDQSSVVSPDKPSVAGLDRPSVGLEPPRAMLRRIAVNDVVVDGIHYGQSVVTLRSDSTVADIHPLTQEEPFTEWIGGTACVRHGELIDNQ